MQPTLKTKKTLIASALALGATSVYAGTNTFTILASTIPDVSISTDTALTFGSAMRITTGLTCTLSATDPAEADLNFDKNGDSTDDAAGSTFGALTGDGCINGSGNGSAAGIYIIEGTGGSTVSITVDPVVDTAFTFTPGEGCVPTYDGSADADACTAISNGLTSSLLIPSGTTEGVASAPNVSVIDELRFSLGGTIEVTNGGADLDPATAYSANFDITVVYE
jgi:hypothetical protein